MTEPRCPICRARRQEQSECPRCGTDLTYPLAIENQVKTAATALRRALLDGDLVAAAELVEQKQQLRRCPLSAALGRWLDAIHGPRIATRTITPWPESRKDYR